MIKKILIVVLILLGTVVLFLDWRLFTGDKNCFDCNQKTNEGALVKIFFASTSTDPNFLDCSRVVAIEREIKNNGGPEKQSLEELLKGPIDEEKANGYFTSINSGVRILDFSVINKQATVDFSEELGAGVGGSCRVASIRSQIENTLKQFPEIESVLIKINGRSEDVLQP